MNLYKKQDFWKEHRYVQFDMVNEPTMYEIFAVIQMDLYSPEWFPFYEYTDMNEIQFDRYIDQCRSRSIYDTKIIPQYGERLITLVTCEYNSNTGRLIVVAKEVEKEQHK